MEHVSSAGGVGPSHPRTTLQVGSVATCDGREAPAATTSAQSDFTAGPLAPAAFQCSPGAATGTEDRDPGAAPDEKVAVAQERVSKLEAALRAVGDDDDTAPSLREALKKARQQAVPLSTQDKVA